MRKKVYKIFINFLEGQENWLNEMATKGYRLVNVSQLYYEFEGCESKEYNYKVEFVVDKTYKELKEYRAFLRDLGIESFEKNINLGKYSFGEIRIRPYIKGKAAIATNPGKINSELLILEKKSDSKPFKLHNNLKEIIKYFKVIRNALICFDIFIIFALTLKLVFMEKVSVGVITTSIFLLALICFFTIGSFKYIKVIRSSKGKEDLIE